MATPVPLFGRKAIVTIDTIEFTSLDFEFRIEKTLKPEPNTCELTVFNLKPDDRAQLAQLGQAPTGKSLQSVAGAKTAKQKAAALATTGIPCRIEAGYDAGTSLVWLGDLRTVQSVLNGSDWTTQLSSGDGEKAWKNARLHVSYGAGTDIETALRAMVRALGIGEGNLSKVVAKLKQAGSAIYPAGCVLSGSVSRQLTDFARSAGLEVSVQDSSLQFQERGVALGGEALRLAPETGLVGFPTVDNNGILTARMLMIPGVRVGSLVTVDVPDAGKAQGTYRLQRGVWTGDSMGQPWYIDFEAARY